MRFQDLAKLRVGVWGAGKEGCSIIRYLQKLFPGNPILLIDDLIPESSLLNELALHGQIIFTPANTLIHARIDVDVLIKSPGISRYRPEIAQAKLQGIYLTTATNLWLGEISSQSRVIAVTGTKGKSTTASILAFLLKQACLDVALGGNIGIPLTDLLQQEHRHAIYVAELSSYQLSDLDVWPEIGVLLNLYPEHIDWHGTTDRYYQDKLNLFSKPGNCISVINYRDPIIQQNADNFPNIVYFNSPLNIHVTENNIMDGGKLVLSGNALKLKGQHNLVNICAALTVAKYLGIDISDVAGKLTEFNGLAHRLEIIGRHNGLTFVDDSISTTPESTMAALEAFTGNTITLLLGGKDRQQDFTMLARQLSQQQIFAIITMHENGDRIAVDISNELKELDYTPIIIQEKDLNAALEKAKSITPQGGIVLLSPAAPSYDAYKNFQERGMLFRQLSCN
jgi:UDP-N-acetylmuramoylalanine--D-glutamate ligase